MKAKNFESLISQCGFKQVISDSTHILESSSSCIDLIFTSQQNLVIKSGIHSSLHPYFTVTAKNTVISANFLVWKFCGKAQIFADDAV